MIIEENVMQKLWCGQGCGKSPGVESQPFTNQERDGRERGLPRGSLPHVKLINYLFTSETGSRGKVRIRA